MFVEEKQKSGSLSFRGCVVLLAALLVPVLSLNLFAKDDEPGKTCSDTAWAAFKASVNLAWNDYWLTIGKAYNLSDPQAEADLLQTAEEEFQQAMEISVAQREARLAICEDLGGDPYDPVIEPNDFVDFQAVIAGEDTLTPNPYFPMTPGVTREYLAKDANGVAVQRILVEVLKEAKEIVGINCIVVHDRVWEIVGKNDEVLIEDTHDWYAQDKDGGVWYFGESVQNLEDGELVSIKGSWKTGRDYAKPGYQMLAKPKKGDVYRQEFALGNAEDMAKVVSKGEESVKVPFGNYTHDVLKTREWSPHEPDVFEFKYYAPGVGLLLEATPDTGERVELINKKVP